MGGEQEGGHAGRREKARVIMCEEDVRAGVWRLLRRRRWWIHGGGCCEHGGATKLVLVSVLVLLRPLDLSVLCVGFLYLRLCGSTAWICIVACRASISEPDS